MPRSSTNRRLVLKEPTSLVEQPPLSALGDVAKFASFGTGKSDAGGKMVDLDSLLDESVSNGPGNPGG